MALRTRGILTLTRLQTPPHARELIYSGSPDGREDNDSAPSTPLPPVPTLRVPPQRLMPSELAEDARESKWTDDARAQGSDAL